MDFLISVKLGKDLTPAKQEVKNEHDTLNFIRQAMIIMQPLEETSADLKAMGLIERVKAGKPAMIEHHTNGKVLVIQVHNDQGD